MNSYIIDPEVEYIKSVAPHCYNPYLYHGNHFTNDLRKRYYARLDEVLRQLKNHQSNPLADLIGKRFEFEGSNADAAEWVSSFGKRKLIRIDGSLADTTTLVHVFETAFDRELPNFFDILRTNRNRKKDQTPFLHSLIESLKKNP